MRRNGIIWVWRQNSGGEGGGGGIKMGGKERGEGGGGGSVFVYTLYSMSAL